MEAGRNFQVYKPSIGQSIRRRERQIERKVKQQTQGFRTQAGAGVSLVRVLGHNTVEKYDPILIMDYFYSTNLDDYTAGSPMHPHRGIETISYMYNGPPIVMNTKVELQKAFDDLNQGTFLQQGIFY